MPHLSKTTKLFSAFAVASVLLGGVATTWHASSHAKDETEANTTVAQAPQAMPVTVMKVAPQAISIWKDFSGRMEAVDVAEIRPRVTGAITEIRFKDGQMVEKGDVLFVIDPRPYEAALAHARAQLKAAETELTFAQRELKRANDLIRSKTIAQRTFDERENQVLIARANVVVAKSAEQQARIDRDYAFIRAPFSGRVGRAEITVGNMVTPGASPVLTTLVSNTGIYAGFSVDERTYLDQIRQHAKTREEERNIPVKITTNGGATTHDGFIDSFDNQINPATGTIRARAFFPNTDGALIPGMFVEIEMAASQNTQRILIDERAIGTNQDRKFVLTVNADNIVEPREVTLGEKVGSNRVVISGLKEGDLVITEGIIRLRPGMPVVPNVSEKS